MQNFHFSLLHCNYLIPSNTTLPLTEMHSEVKQMCTYPQELKNMSLLDYTTDSRVHRQTHDPWVSQGNLVCLLAPWRTYERNFSELISKQVRLVAGLRSFYTCGPTHGRLLCHCRNCHKNLLCSKRWSQYCFDVR